MRSISLYKVNTRVAALCLFIHLLGVRVNGQTLTLDLSKDSISHGEMPWRHARMNGHNKIYVGHSKINLVRHYDYVNGGTLTGGAIKSPSGFICRKSIIFDRDTFTTHTEIPFFNGSGDRGLDFSFANFAGGVYIERCAFNQAASFSSSNLAYFYAEYSHFKDAISFSGNNFLHVYFTENTFDKSVDYSGCSFSCQDNYNNFQRNVFKSITSFKNCFFRNQTFSLNSFTDKIYFNGAVFSHNVFFERDTLSELDFSNACLPDTIVFSSSKLIGEVDFININIDTGQKSIEYNVVLDSTYKRNKPPYCLVLYGCDVAKFKMNYAYFTLLPMKYIGYGKFEPLARDEGIALYEGLLKNFKDRGQLESFEKLDIEYRKYRWSSGHWTVSWIGVISDLWWQFGYSKGRIFIWTIVLLIFFTVPTLFCLRYFNENVYQHRAIVEKINIYEEYDSAPESSFESLSRRIWYSFVYTGSIFLSLTLKMERLKFQHDFKAIVGTLYVLLVYAVGIICLGYIANFVLQK